MTESKEETKFIEMGPLLKVIKDYLKDWKGVDFFDQEKKEVAFKEICKVYCVEMSKNQDEGKPEIIPKDLVYHPTYHFFHTEFERIKKLKKITGEKRKRNELKTTPKSPPKKRAKQKIKEIVIIDDSKEITEVQTEIIDGKVHIVIN